MACELIEPFAVQEFFVDGGEGQIDNGMYIWTGFRWHQGQKIAVYRSIMRLSDVPAMQADTRAVLAAANGLTVPQEDRVGVH